MIQVYFSDTTPLNDPALFQSYFEQMSEERRKKTDRYWFVKDKNLCLGAGILLDHGLHMYGLREAEMQYDSFKNGKPYFINEPSIHFSLSHSETKVMAAFSDCEIGCDIEKVTDIDLNIAKRFFYKSEYAAIMKEKNSQDQKDAFFRLWTLKESFMKVTGLGMALPLDAFEIKLRGTHTTVVQNIDDGAYYFREFDAFHGYKSALCSRNHCADAVFSYVPFLHK